MFAVLARFVISPSLLLSATLDAKCDVHHDQSCQWHTVCNCWPLTPAWLLLLLLLLLLLPLLLLLLLLVTDTDIAAAAAGH